jgi:hypothetical protein
MMCVKLELGMENRIDQATAFHVNQAIKIKKSRGERAAVKFLQEQNVPIEIALRVVSKTFCKSREI